MNIELATTDGEIVPSHGGMASVAEIEAQIHRAERMGEALDKLRSLAIKRTVAGDWVFHGEQAYLEGDGALRIAPMIGLRLANVVKTREVQEDGVIRVTTTLDASSALFGTEFAGVSRTRTTADQFLRQGRDRADLEDVESASYKGAVARAVQLLAGLSGLSRSDLKDRFGLGVEGGSVAYKGGQSEAKKADAVEGSDDVKEVHRILLKLFGEDKKSAGDALEAITEKKGPDGFAGVRDPNKLTAKRAAWSVKKLREREAKFDAEVIAGEGGAE